MSKTRSFYFFCDKREENKKKQEEIRYLFFSVLQVAKNESYCFSYFNLLIIQSKIMKKSNNK
jgi:hypothetical protein